MSVGRFMCGIAAIIWNPKDDTYLLLKRSSEKDMGANEWECVTGRVNQGEMFEEAVYREVREETCVEATIELIINTTQFYRGEPVSENEMLSVQYLCTLDDPTQIKISDEHSEFRWLTSAQIAELLQPSHWLVRTIHRARSLYKLMSPELRQLHRDFANDPFL